jgi:hypothetical protein
MRIAKGGRKKALSVRTVGTGTEVGFAELGMRLILRRRAPSANGERVLNLVTSHFQKLLQEVLKSGWRVSRKVLPLGSPHIYL